MGLSKLEASELGNGGICAEKAVSTNRVEFVVEAEMVLLLGLRLGKHSSLQLDGLLDHGLLVVLGNLLEGGHLVVVVRSFTWHDGFL